MTRPRVKILVQRSYLGRIRDAIGTSMFKSLYALVDGKEVDILESGRKSCALFVSTVLVGFELARTVHATVEGTISDMERSGWIRLRRLKKGCVIVWKDYLIDNQPHDHIGFYVGNGRAVSNSSDKGSPHEHSSSVHEIATMWWHPRLEK